ncbi:Serine protease [Rhyzopertha dominica]|nr:Serine protease [Rhyzopertha dominica]
MHCLVLLAALIVTVSAAPSTKVLVPMLDGRIVGGEPVQIEQYNYQASLLYFSSHRCGAVIVSPTVVLTAAHCTDRILALFLSIRVGSSTRNSGGVVVAVSQLHQHPQYSSSTIDYDISVLVLASSLSFTNAIGPVALPRLNDPLPVGQYSVVTGWGALSEGGASASQLQAVGVPVVSLEACRAAYGQNRVSEFMMCAGYPEGGKDACQGDSGGPLVVDGILIGLVSWGAGCARPGFPGVYANVQTLRDYITNTVGL